MNNQKHNWILYLISVTILATIVIQFYWNYKNYEQNKQRVLNEIQLSLDNSIEIYFAEFARKNHLTIIQPDGKFGDYKTERKKILQAFFKPLKKQFETLNKVKDSVKFKIESLEFTTDDPEEFKKMNPKFLDSLLKSNPAQKIEQIKFTQKTELKDRKHNQSLRVFKGKKALDSINLIKGINKILVSVTNDSLNLQTIDSILQKQLYKKNIKLQYAFTYYKNDSLFSDFNGEIQPKLTKTIEAKSTFLGKEKQFKMLFNNPNAEALKRSSTGILLSLLLSLAVISSLFYLLKIINQQKQLAEIKNDLISNITHEFKTPITTVSTALEAINNFNVINDKEKTQNYVDISKSQVEKLHLMVEKLLETATLDSEKLLLKKEETNLIPLIEKLTKKHQLISPEKKISFESTTNKIITSIDIFHFENAVSNLIDNAIKYGGNEIEVYVNTLPSINQIEIGVVDNGTGVEKTQRDKIFDKFYRVPKGNTHDVKGFGIGLYYTKKITEKHNGIIDLKSNTNQTTFTISLPYEY